MEINGWTKVQHNIKVFPEEGKKGGDVHLGVEGLQGLHAPNIKLFSRRLLLLLLLLRFVTFSRRRLGVLPCRFGVWKG